MILVGRYQEMESQGKRALVIHCSRSSLHRWHLIDLLTLQSQQWFATWNCNSSPLSGKITKIYNLHFIMTWDPPYLNFEQFQWYPHDYCHVPVGKLSSWLQGLRVSHQHWKWQFTRVPPEVFKLWRITYCDEVKLWSFNFCLMAGVRL